MRLREEQKNQAGSVSYPYRTSFALVAYFGTKYDHQFNEHIYYNKHRERLYIRPEAIIDKIKKMYLGSDYTEADEARFRRLFGTYEDKSAIVIWGGYSMNRIKPRTLHCADGTTVNLFEPVFCAYYGDVYNERVDEYGIHPQDIDDIFSRLSYYPHVAEFMIRVDQPTACEHIIEGSHLLDGIRVYVNASKDTYNYSDYMFRVDELLDMLKEHKKDIARLWVRGERFELIQTDTVRLFKELMSDKGPRTFRDRF